MDSGCIGYKKEITMKILVTGANGYLGNGIVKQLIKEGHYVVASCRDKSNLIAGEAEIKTGNIFEIEQPYEYFGQPDVLLHLAWKNGFVHGALSHLEDLPKHYIFIKKLAESGIKKIVVMGSMHEVGFFEGSIKPETPTNPLSLYGISKNALRNSVIQLCKHNGIKYQWLRGFYIVGNSEYGCSIFSKIVQAVNAGKTTFPFTSGQNQWDFLDYDLFCHQTACAVIQDEYDDIINICSGRPEKLADRVERFIKENNFNISLEYGKYPDREYDSKAVWGDDSVISKILLRNGARNEKQI